MKRRHLLSLLALSAFVAATRAEAQTATVTGTVFEDRNANGRRDTGEPGVGNVSVSDGAVIVKSDVSGRYRLALDPSRRVNEIVFVTVPAGYRAPLDADMV